MEMQNLKPRRGSDTYRLDDSDDLVVMENIGSIPTGKVLWTERLQESVWNHFLP